MTSILNIFKTSSNKFIIKGERRGWVCLVNNPVYNTVYEIKRKRDVWSRAHTLNKYFLVSLELYNIKSISFLTIAICNKFFIFFLSIQQSSELHWYQKKQIMCRYTLLLSAGVLAILLANRGEKCFVQGLPISETYGESFCFYPFFYNSSIEMVVS